MWHDIETGFNRAFRLSFSRKKIIFLLPFLLASGLIVVFSHMIGTGSSPWIHTGLSFIPAFLCLALFLAAGVVIIRFYHDQIKERPLRVHRTLRHSWSLMTAISSLIVPLLTADIVLWFTLGFFYLLKNIPSTGEVLGGILSFGPFLLISGSILLCVVALLLLFFLTPMVALKSKMSWELAEEVLKRVQQEPFIHGVLILVGLLPLMVVVGFLVLSAALTGMTYFVPERTWATGLQWFVIMIPFACLISPFILFFFNFAAESFVILQRRLPK